MTLSIQVCTGRKFGTLFGALTRPFLLQSTSVHDLNCLQARRRAYPDRVSPRHVVELLCDKNHAQHCNKTFWNRGSSAQAPIGTQRHALLETRYTARPERVETTCSFHCTDTGNSGSRLGKVTKLRKTEGQRCVVVLEFRHLEARPEREPTPSKAICEIHQATRRVL